MDQTFRLYLLYSDKYVISEIFVVSSVIFDHCVNIGHSGSHFYTVTKDKEIVLKTDTLNKYIYIYFF